MTGPVLALDLGSRRIGMAVSDPEGGFAFPAGILARTSPEADLAALAEFAASWWACRST